MKKRYKILAMLFIMSLPFNYVTGQDSNYASNVNRYLSLDGKQLVIKYDLHSADTTQLFDIILKIYYNDKVIQPHDSALTGSWGSKVSPGIEKVILWDFPNEFKGDINKVSIEVVAKEMNEPLANFNYEVLTKKPPFEVKFENVSRNADSFSWEFGDSKSTKDNFSALLNPVHHFKSIGTYNVKLTAGNSKAKTSSNTTKTLSLGNGNMKLVDLQKFKKQRVIWLGSAIIFAGVGTYSLIKSNNLYDEYKTATYNTNDLSKKYKTYGVIGTVSIVASGFCVFEVLMKSMKIKSAEKKLSMIFVPTGKGGAYSIACIF
jgi:hypothetical protein